MSGRLKCHVCIVCLLVWISGVALGASPYDRAAYWDGNYGTAWAGDGAPVRDALETAGYTILDAAQLKTWMDGHIADKKLSVVVFCRDAAPDTVCEEMTANCTLRKYLDAGGKIVWYSDIPFYYMTTAGGTNTTWGDAGSTNVLGFGGSTAPRDSGNVVTITEAGTEWGLTTPWTSTRPTLPDAWDNLTILAVDNAGNASGWAAHYVPGDTFRGFVRIEDHSGAPASIDNLIAVAEYGQLPTTAISPIPDDGATDVPRDSDLAWGPSETAVTHNVYFGDTWADVNSATTPDASGDANSFDPGRLEFGKTYFWRVDEVNGAPDRTVFKGFVWSFTAEPYSIRIPIDISYATASSFAPKNPPALTVDDSGLNGMTHSAVPETMWLSAGADFSPWLMYEFNRVEKLDRMLIWNSNSTSEAFIGWGIKDVSIEYSSDGVEWTALAAPTQLDRAPGLATYDTPQVIDFGSVAAKYVKLNIQSNWGGILPQYGVSEVQFYGIPVYVREPVPASGSVDVRPDAVASWRAGRDAGEHTIYASSDSNAVVDGSAPSASSATNSADLSAFDLQMSETYYWRVDEVNDAEVPSVWAGPVWSLSTSTSLVVEDFESYTNFSPNRPFQTWTDGFGYSADEFFPVLYAGNGTGAGIGHDIWSPSSPNFDGSIMEKDSTIAGSSQSMPFYYSNTGGVASMTERTFAVPQDWTVGSAKTLSIAFAGQAGNTGTLYVKINTTKLVYPHAATNIAQSGWQAWNIDLASVNTNLKSVTKLQIGVDGSGAAGMLLIDDIKLHAEVGQVITPVDPGADGLVAKFTFEGNMNDTSGKGHNGTVVGTDGTTIVTDPVRGQVLSLPGGDDQYVAVGAVGISGNMPRTIACWAKAANTGIPDWTLIFGFTGQADGTGANGSHFNIGSLGGPGGIGAHCWGWEETMVSDQEGLNWHHYAMTYDGTTIAYFLDGLAMDSDSAKSNVQDLSVSADRVHIGSRITQTSSFPGNVDDAVIYNRVLTAGEILSLAGKTSPVDKPF